MTREQAINIIRAALYELADTTESVDPDDGFDPTQALAALELLSKEKAA